MKKGRLYKILWLSLLFSLPNCTSMTKEENRLSSPNNSQSFRILSIGSGKCLVYRPDRRFTLSQETCGDNENQLFSTRSAGISGQQLYPSHTPSRCLTIEEMGDRTQLNVAPCTPNKSNAAHNIVTIVKSFQDPRFVNIKFQPDKCLDLLNHSRSNGGLFHEYNCIFKPSQDFLLSPDQPTVPFPRIIWTFWDKGYKQMPAFYQANVDYWEKILNSGVPDDKKWSIRVVNLDSTLRDENYFGNFYDENDLPTIKFLNSKLTKAEKANKLNPFVIISDFVRLRLLLKHGGIWMDPSIILHKNFEDFTGIMEKIGGVKVFGYTSRHQTAGNTLYFADSLENFFFLAHKESDLIHKWSENFDMYWNEKEPGMDISDHPMFNGQHGEKISVAPYKKLKNYLNQHTALKYTLTHNKKLLEDVLIIGDASAEEKGPLTLLDTYNWDDQNLLKLQANDFPNVLNLLKNVQMSKFPSDNSVYVRFVDGDKPPEERELRKRAYFEDPTNIFGYLNSLSISLP